MTFKINGLEFSEHGIATIFRQNREFYIRVLEPYILTLKKMMEINGVRFAWDSVERDGGFGSWHFLELLK